MFVVGWFIDNLTRIPEGTQRHEQDAHASIGTLSGRFPDLEVSNGVETIIIQVGKATKKSRRPISRERWAIKDLRDSGEFDKVIFLEY
ncbi:hypothetical protein [Maribacter cobaltidurans]|uniref:Uncharacterized protein n=1 Tax=Maribacter cobaltidurans TaxID=1178778 RepID=A0A223V4F6_9FLAO|nr:hypothetical protein [Maribacter cobaltidurans]ASV30087.1 hypothetical protein CJ263_07535 [Maribacter cobaltidurans]GGD87315.1 hypothetical protein GCM10011412_26370 [Maribacter cobaltidurans]